MSAEKTSHHILMKPHDREYESNLIYYSLLSKLDQIIIKVLRAIIIFYHLFE